MHAALSAVLGGVVNIAAVVVYAVVLGCRIPATSAGGTVVAMFRAEASKILVIVVQLWLVLTTYKDVVLAASVRRIRDHGVAVPHGLSRSQLSSSLHPDSHGGQPLPPSTSSTT